MSSARVELKEQLSNFKVGMLTTRSEEWGLHSRPMAIADLTSQGEIYLITHRDSAKVEELEKDNRVTFSCQDDKGRFVTVTGTALLTNDPFKIEECWRTEFDTWFPDGRTEVLLILLEPLQGELWDTSGLQKAKYLLEIVKAKISNTSPNVEPYHESVNLSHDHIDNQ